ncbi:MAG: hypothetical protein ACK2UF_06095 [Candidatus Promineifilaceae bacterium]|jgi:hypothetical protein
MKDRQLEELDWLLEKGKIVEQPFSSKVPVFGPVIAWFRTKWNSVATKWYVRPMLEQQNDFNRLAVERLREFETISYEFSLEQEHELGRLRHDLAALHLQLTQLNRRLAELDDRLEHGDTDGHNDIGQGEA